MKPREVKELLAAGHFMIRDKGGGTKSDVWRYFQEVIDVSGVFQNFVKCRNCEKVLAYKGRKSGTSCLLRHKHNCEPSPNVITLTADALQDTLLIQTSVLKAKDVKELIRQGIFYLREKTNGRSSIWSDFQQVVNESGEVQDFVKCKNCDVVLSFKESASCTSHLRRHNKKCLENNSGLSDLLKSQNPVSCVTLVQSDVNQLDVSNQNITSCIVYNSPQLQLNDVYKLLESGIFSVHDKAGQKSSLWKLFQEVVNEKGEYQGFVKCRNCHRIFTFVDQKSGNSQLSRHKVICQRNFRLGKERNSSQLTCPAEMPSTLLNVTDSVSVSDVQIFDVPLNINPVSSEIDSHPDIGDDLARYPKSRAKKIAKLIDSGVFYARQREKGKASIWRMYEEVVNGNGEFQNYVKCLNCGRVLVFRGHKSGSSHLKRHQQKCRKPKIPKLSKEFQRELLKRCAALCTKDMRPHDFVHGEAFIELAQCLINIGAVKGRIRARDVLPTEAAITEQIRKETLNRNQKIPPDLLPALRYGFGVSLNLVCEKPVEKTYTTIKVHYVDDNYQMKSHVLSTAEVDCEAALSSANLMDNIVKYVLQVELGESTLQNIVFVSNQYKISDSCNVMCIYSCLNQILLKVLDKENLPSEIQECISEAQHLASYLQESGLCSDYTKNMFQSSENYWSTLYLTVQWIQKMYQNLKSSEDSVVKNSLKNLSTDTVEFIVQFLNLFHRAFQQLKPDNDKPNLHRVLPWYFGIRDFLVRLDEKASHKLLKADCLSCLDQMYCFHNLHKVATFLSPKFRQLRMLSTVEADQVYSDVRQRLRLIEQNFGTEEKGLLDPVTGLQSDISTHYTISDSQNESSEFVEFEDFPRKDDNDEVSRYITKQFEEDWDEIGLIRFWFNNRLEFPLLSKLARSLLCVPASCSSGTAAVYEKLLTFT